MRPVLPLAPRTTYIRLTSILRLDALRWVWTLQRKTVQELKVPISADQNAVRFRQSCDDNLATCPTISALSLQILLKPPRRTLSRSCSEYSSACSQWASSEPCCWRKLPDALCSAACCRPRLAELSPSMSGSLPSSTKFSVCSALKR